MFAAAVPPALRALDQALGLARIARPDMLGARLHPGMFSCEEQLETVASFALRATFPLTSLQAPAVVQSPAQEALLAAKAAIQTLTVADFDGAAQRRVIHVAGFAELDQSASDYLHQFAQPNLWFHLSMAYAIMRHMGADIGKAAFDGLHSYPADFSFPP